MARTLNETMEFYCPVTVDDSGNVSTSNEYAPEVEWFQGPDADRLMAKGLAAQGWEVMDGYSGQYGYSGPIMHASEYIGGRMETDILDTPGIYVALTVSDYTEEESEPFGWIVAFIPAQS